MTSGLWIKDVKPAAREHSGPSLGSDVPCMADVFIEHLWVQVKAHRSASENPRTRMVLNLWKIETRIHSQKAAVSRK